ncbi:MAG: site-specific integrase [Spiribacter salinus]|uniref:Site-specific integrase n=1 Tax=Spiribacter salinus TaxID=1335746 RepID=A0A540VN23_9GAMM|nr:MAG: site-specific integrase [Spiribacter salinus]
MARTVRDSRLQNRTARTSLEARSKPYFLTLHEGLHLGYRKNKAGGRWVVRWYAGDGQYRTKTIGTADDSADADGVSVFDFRQAQEKARELSTELAANKQGVRLGPYTVADALDDYFRGRDSAADNIGAEQRRAQLYINDLIGEKLVDELTRDDLKTWRDKVAAMPPMTRSGKPRVRRSDLSDDERADYERGRKDSANRVLGILKAALNYAFDNGHASSDHAWRRLKKFETATKARVRYLSRDEVTRLLNAAQGQFRTLVRGALLTGARYGDLAAMNVGDFNPDRGLVMSGNSKGSKPHPVYLTDEGVEFFRNLTAGRKNTEPMFTHNGGRWKKSEQNRPMRAAVEAARIDPPITFHGLRHTYCSHAIMAGVPMLVVAHNVGHADTRMIEAHYGHLADSYKADAIRAGLPSWGGESESNVVPLAGAK